MSDHGTQSTPSLPDIILLVRAESKDQGTRLHFETFTAEAGWVSHGDSWIRGDATTSLDSYFREIESLTKAEKKASNALRGIGIQIAADVLPRTLLDLLAGRIERDSDARAPSLLILSNETWIPWELMHISLLVKKGAEHRGVFLGEAFIMAQWLAKSADSLRDLQPTIALTRQRRAIVISAGEDLEAALQEGEAIKAIDEAAEQIPATLRDVIASFDAAAFDGWHFAGHGVTRARTEADLTDALQLDQDQVFKAAEIPPLTDKIRATRPLVFLNSCHGGRGALGLTGIGGWARHFIEAGAGAFVGPRWAIRDQASSTFASEVYGRLFEGMPLAEAVFLARREVRKGNPQNPTWLAYATFASPSAHLVDSALASAGGETPPMRDPGVEKAIRRLQAPTRKRWVLGLVAVTLAALVILGVLVPRTAAPPPRSGVAVLTFENVERAERLQWLEAALPEALSRLLTIDGRVWVAERQRTVLAEGALGKRQVGTLSVAERQRLREALGVSTVIVGSFKPATDGSRIEVETQVYLASNDEPAAQASAVGSMENWPNLVRTLATPAFQRAVSGEAHSESFAEVQTFRASLPTTLPSAESYMRGLQDWRRFDLNGASEHFDAAVAGSDDPHPLLLAHHAALLHVLGKPDQATASIHQAFDAVDRRRGTSSELPNRWLLEIEAIAGQIEPESPERPAGQRTIDAYERLFRSWQPEDIGYGLLFVDALVSSGRLDDARLVLDELRALPGADRQSDLDYLEAEIWFEQEAFDRAGQAADRAAAKARANSSARGEGLALLLEAASQISTESDSAPATLRRAIELLEATVPRDRLSLAQASELEAQLSVDNREAYLQQAIDEYRALGRTSEVARAQVQLAIFQAEVGHLDNAKETLAAASATDQRVWSRRTEGTFEFITGYILHVEGRLDDASRHYAQALAKFEASSRSTHKAATLTNLGEIQYARGNLQSALDLHREAFEITEGSQNQEHAAYDLFRQGLVLAAKGEYRPAAEAYDAALSRLDLDKTDPGTIHFVGEIQLALASVQWLDGNADLAEATLDAALPAVSGAELHDLVARLEALSGRVALAQGRIDDARARIEAAEARDLADFRASFEVRLARAELDAAVGRGVAVIDELQRLIDEIAADFKLQKLEAVLVLGRIELDEGRGDATLRSLQRRVANTEYRQIQRRLADVLDQHRPAG